MVTEQHMRPEESQQSGRTENSIRYGNTELFPDRGVVLRAGEPVALSPKELRLLEYLMCRRGRAVSREELLRAVWDTRAPVRTRTVDMHIRKLRRALPELRIVTVFKFGYRLE